MKKTLAGIDVRVANQHRNGYPCLSRGARALSARAWQELRRALKLSPRELQIVRGIFDDKLEYAIAIELGVSANTVHTQTRRLRSKLKAAGRMGIVLCVLEEFLRLTTSDEAKLPSICRNHSAGRCPLLRAAK